MAKKASKKTPIINYQVKWKEQKVQVVDLVLDPNNVRLETGDHSQDEIINDLFANEDAMTILENIAQNGYYPDEPPVVIREKSKFIVLEGNRRVVSLKAMISPSIAPSKFVPKIQKLMSDRLPIETIFVHVAASRDEAMEYLASKHTKTTRRPWSALRRAYFYYAQKEQGQSIEKLIERYKGVDIPDYIRMYEMHNVATSLKNITEDTRRKVSNKGKFNISTLERFYSDKFIQDKLSISFNKKTGEASVPSSDEFDKVYSHIVTDIAHGIATSRKELSNEKSRKKYINSVVEEVIGDQTIEAKSIKPAASFKPTKAKSTKKLSLVPQSVEDTLEAPGVGRVLLELQTIDYERFPNATADLLRTFLEVVLKKYLQEVGSLPAPKRTGRYIFLDDVLNKIRSDLAKIPNHGLVQVIDEIKKNKWYLESINHNPDVFAVPDRVKDAWDQIYPIIKHVFEDYKKNNK